MPRCHSTALGCPEALAELGFTEAPAEYDPDKLWNYELGAKLSFARRASLNVAAYRIDWRDVQQTVFLAPSLPENVASPSSAM